MASILKVNPDNTPGPLFVDTTCINCGTCYHLAPEIFREKDDRSIVSSLPVTPHEWIISKMAMVSCPTNSIGVMDAPIEFKEASIQLPHLICENIYYCGYTSKDSYGASSYFITHPEGNILIDSPRFHPALIKELESMGGVQKMFLTHQDDVADHELFAEHFGCQRYIDFADVNISTKYVEHHLKFDDPLSLNNDFLLISTPGHTKGHMVFLYKNEYLFTGDHLFFDIAEQTLSASKNVCWFSWDKQIESMEKLLQYSFEWILPGHGGWGYKTKHEMRDALLNLIAKMKKQNERI